MVLLVGLDERHSLYQVINWNITETLRILLCLSVFGRYFIIVFVGIWEIFIS